MKTSFGLSVTACLVSSLVSFISMGHATDTLLSPDSWHMHKDVQRLSHPDFKGRQTGTEGGRRSAEFVAARFDALGLMPAGHAAIGRHHKPWAQTRAIAITSIGAPTMVEWSTLILDRPSRSVSLHLNGDYLPVFDSPSVNVTAPVVFVGYGISDPARGWDEYEGMDVRNRVVMFLRGKPTHYPLHIHHTEKERLARERGAVGFITLTGPVLSRYAARRGMGHQPLAFYTNASSERPLPGIWMSGKAGAELFQAQGLSLQDIQERLNQQRTAQSRELRTLVRMKWASAQQTGSMINVLGMLPGQDPVLKHETIMVGAHRDHFGTQAGLLFPGADDNASGTAVLLELARILKHGEPPKRTILFASFSGEEQNMLGSTWYVHHPQIPLTQTVAMINVDHVGIGNGNLTVGVTNMPKERAIGTAKRIGLADKVQFYGFFPGGDHVPFAKAGIPTVAVVSAGKHPHFHQASDSSNTIQPKMLNTSAHFVLGLIRDLANSD